MKFKFGDLRVKRVIDFKQILPEIISDLELEDSFIIDDLKRRWKDIAGEILASHSIPDRIHNRKLFILSDHSVYANELMMMKDFIIKKLNQGISSVLINDLRVDIKRLKWYKK